MGNFLTRASWRQCFAINLPIGVVAIVVIAILLHTELLGPQTLLELEGRDASTRRGRLWAARITTVDYGGEMLFLLGMGLLSLALTWGGGTYPWSSVAVLTPLVTGALLSVCWILYEYGMCPGNMIARVFPFQRAMVDWRLISTRDIGILLIVNCALGMAMFAVIYFVDIYFVLVDGKSSSDAGLTLLYYIPGMGVGSIMAMLSSNVWPRQTLPSLLLGSITAAVGITVMPWAVHAGNDPVIFGMMALVGHGVGMRLNPVSLHGLAFFPAATAQISCLLSFSMPFGGLVGLTIMSTVFTNKSGTWRKDPRDGIMWAFITMIPFMWLCVFAATFLGNVWNVKESAGHEVVHGAHLWSLVTGNKLKREIMTRAKACRRLATRGTQILLTQA